MQMYDNEYIDDGQYNDKDKREKRKKKHRKPKDEIPDEPEVVNGGGEDEPSRRRSEEENYEPSNENRRKHRHRRSRVEEDVASPDIDARVADGDDRLTAEEYEEAKRQRKEKKRRARERKQLEEEAQRSALSGSVEQQQNDPYYEDDQQDGQYEQEEHNSLQEEEELPVTPPPEEPPGKAKKKGGGFGKIFASFKKRPKTAKPEPAPGINDQQWQSTPELFNPAYDSQPNTLKKSIKKIRGKSSRDGTGQKTRVILLDGEEVEMDFDPKATGLMLFDKVCDDLDLIEKDFFGMTYVSSKLQTWFWLEMDKKIAKQLGKDDEWTFNFQVKFYPPEPVLLQEDLTRYLLSLQVRQDVFTGKLPCSWITQALLGSFMVQSELGDYDGAEHDEGGIDYLREFEFVLNQSEQLLEKICELHKKHKGMSPDRADIKYMETAKRLEQYGVDLHPARDNDDVEIFIGVSYQGVLIYRDRLRIGRFAWPKVLRISYKKNYFYLKIRSDRYDDSVAIVGFKLYNHNLAKRLWKNAAEQHTFFRMKEPQMVKSGSRIIPSTSATIAYSGKTLHQYRTMNIARTQPAHFDRSLTKRRTIGSMPAGLNRAGMQYSSMHSLNRAHPRDMTLGKTKSVEYLSSKRPGSNIALSHEREGSVGSFSQSRQAQPTMYPPYGSGSSFKEDDRHQSFRSGDSLNGGDSYTVNHDDQISLPSMSRSTPQEYGKPVKKHRSKPPSVDALSDDGCISPLPRDKVKLSVKSSKAVPLPLPPDPESDSETESIPKPRMKVHQSKQPEYAAPVPQSHNRVPPQFKPPPPLPDPIPEMPSISSSMRSSPVDHHMPPPPPPPPADLHSPTDTNKVIYSKTVTVERSKPPPVKPKPAVKPKPNVVTKERTVVTKTTTTTSSSRRRDDFDSNDDML